MKFNNFLNIKEKALLILSVVLFTLSTLTSSILILVSFQMIFSIMKNEYTPIMNYWIAIVGVYFLGVICESIADLIKHYLGFSIVEKIRENVTLRLKKFSLGFYTDEKIGEISNIVQKDVDNMEMIVAHIWSRMFASIAVSTIIGIGLFIYNWQMGLALISFIPIAFLILFKGTKSNSQKNKINQDNLNDMLCLFVEYVKGISVIKAFKYKVFKQKIDSSVDLFGKSSIGMSDSIGKVVFGYMFNLEICYAVLTAFGTYLVLGNSLSIMSYIIFVVLGKEFYKPFFSVDDYWVQYISVRESLDRISKITKAPIISDKGKAIIPDDKSLEFKNVDFQYEKDSFSINNINFKVKKNTLTALVGSSGSGKTTITNLILRFYNSYNGSILIGDTEIKDISYDDLLANISIVMQNVTLFSGTIYENIMMGNQDATKEMVEEAAIKAMIHEEIIDLADGYQTQLGEGGYGLSGGQKQRLSIARAFLKDAPIVILDEATSSIDPINERKIQRGISNLIKNRTILVVAHNLKTIQNADQIVVFDKGRIIEKGTHKRLLKNNSKYSELWNAQISI